MRATLFFFTIVCVVILSSGCSSGQDGLSAATDTPLPAITSNPTKTATVAPTQTPTLPHTLYFLVGSQGDSQVWRLERDGASVTQITHEKTNVDAFAVSPKDGRIAFISDNQLTLLDEEGENRSLIADGQAVDINIEDYYFRSQISSPVFSPDGRMLAYGFDGLHLYDLATGEDNHVLTNLGNLMGEVFVFSKEAYVPGAWSPDGRELLIIMGYYEGSTLAVMELDTEQPFRRLRSDGPVCCLFDWSPDGRTILVSNPYYTVDVPGLWRFDAQSGQESVVISGLQDDGSINYVGWPKQLGSGELLFFQVNIRQFSPDVGIPLTLVRSDSNGMNPIQVRAEEFHISEALWVQDGSMAIILQSSGNEMIQIIMARTDGAPLQILFEGQGIRNLMWGP
jgi:WD40 repeat protein